MVELFILFQSLFYFLFPDPRQLDEDNNKKMKTLSISWVVAEKLMNYIEIAELPEIIIFFTRKKKFIDFQSF